MTERSASVRAVRQGVPELIDRMSNYVALMSIRSNLPIDVLIPVAGKDAEILPYTVDAVRRHVRHPISTIFIVSPESQGIRTLCRRKGCEFVDERQLAKLGPESIHLEVRGIDRSNWIYQQFLKWSGDLLTKHAHYLVVDADTVLVRPQVFEREGRTIFNYSDEYHQPYFDMYSRLLKERVSSPVSFTSHQMLIEVGVLRQLRERIEQLHECDWQQAILRNLDRNEMSGCSDYDNYAQYFFLHCASRMAIEYWYNLGLTRKNVRSLRLLELQYGGKYKSLSFHSYRS